MEAPAGVRPSTPGELKRVRLVTWGFAGVAVTVAVVGLIRHSFAIWSTGLNLCLSQGVISLVERFLRPFQPQPVWADRAEAVIKAVAIAGAIAAAFHIAFLSLFPAWFPGSWPLPTPH